jgi:alcohol dehydrogenase (cytochrome c)
VALEADTGRVIWTYERKLPEGIPLCCGRVNRGLAVLGDLLFLGTLDAHLVALHADNGTVAWETKVAEYKEGYSITGAPLALKDKVITGIAGGDYATRGFIAAYDFRTGKEIWRFHTIPEPGQPGNETWSGDSWRSGGCATWLTGSFDPEQNIVLWGVGNPAPDYNGDVRQGDNLYSNSIVALDADSGRLKWHFQFTPHDEHDWDSVHIPVLVDEEFSGRPRKLLLWANRSAFYYLLDRQTGEYLGSRAFAEQTWADGIDAKGRPVTRPESRPTKTGVLVSPGRHGATNWWSPSFSPITRLIYVPVSNSQNVFFKTEATVVHGEMYMAGVAHGRPTWAAFRALDFATGDLRWEYRPSGRAPLNLGGLLSTAGDVVFGGIGPTFFVLDAESGALLREFTLGGGVAAAPITYETAGRQQVTIAAGRSIFTFALHDVQAAAP